MNYVLNLRDQFPYNQEFISLLVTKSPLMIKTIKPRFKRNKHIVYTAIENSKDLDTLKAVYSAVPLYHNTKKTYRKIYITKSRNI